MKILEPEKLEAGEPFKIDLTEGEIDTLILIALKDLIKESGLPVVAVKASENIEGVRTHDLTEDELSELVSIGFNAVLKNFINKELEDEKNGS